MILVICKQCGKKFKTKPCYIKRGGGKYCSHKCFGLSCKGIKISGERLKNMSEAHKGIKHTEETKKKLSEIAKKQWADPIARRKIEKAFEEKRNYLGEKNPFYGKHHTDEAKKNMSLNHVRLFGKNNHNWKEKVECTCIECNNKFKIIPSEAKERKFCNKKCHDSWKSKNDFAENNNNWRGGKSFEPYSTLFNKQLKERIRVRDNFTCQLCGVPELECNRRLSVHHIDYDKKNCEADNLILLCASCNSKVNKNRNNWKLYFKEKLFGKKSTPMEENK